LCFIISIAIILILRINKIYHFPKILVYSFYQVISVFTTTGFSSSKDFINWPIYLIILLIFIGIIGGCSGSTSGGIKFIRIILYTKQIFQEIKYLIHPYGTFPIKLDQDIISKKIISSAWSFLAIYIFVFLIMWILLISFGLDFKSAFFSIATCISNTGINLGINFSKIGNLSQYLLSFAMIMGRLEFFSILILFSPIFWRR